MPNFLAFVQNKSGATAIAYALLIVGFAIAIVAVIIGLDTDFNVSFVGISSYFK